jgi:hypothetical protein
MSNILPYQHKKLVRQLRILRVGAATMWAMVILVVAAILLLIPVLVMVNSSYKVAEEQITQLERVGAVTNPVDIAALETRVAALSTKLSVPLAPAPTDYIDIIRSVSSMGITLSGFSMENDEAPSLEVAGTAASREALQRFVGALEKAESVESVDSPVSNYVKSTSSPFQITVLFKQPS